MKEPKLPDVSVLESKLGNRFRVGDILGRGGQGIVFRASRSATSDGIETNDIVALKFYYNKEHDERIEREIAAMEHIRHRSLAALVEHGQLRVNGQPLRFVAWE